MQISAQKLEKLNIQMTDSLDRSSDLSSPFQLNHINEIHSFHQPVSSQEFVTLNTPKTGHRATFRIRWILAFILIAFTVLLAYLFKSG